MVYTYWSTFQISNSILYNPEHPNLTITIYALIKKGTFFKKLNLQICHHKKGKLLTSCLMLLIITTYLNSAVLFFAFSNIYQLRKPTIKGENISSGQSFFIIYFLLLKIVKRYKLYKGLCSQKLYSHDIEYRFTKNFYVEQIGPFMKKHRMDLSILWIGASTLDSFSLYCPFSRTDRLFLDTGPSDMACAFITAI